jgi:hypothetical protein
MSPWHQSSRECVGLAVVGIEDGEEPETRAVHIRDAAQIEEEVPVSFDLDVVPSLNKPSWEAAVNLLWALGARPRIPEPLERIRDVEHVRR